MASSGSVFSATLQTITNAKLEELAKQRAVYDEQYASILSGAATIKDPLEQLIYLVDKAKPCLGVKTETRKNNDGRPGRVMSGYTNSGIETDVRNSGVQSALLDLWHHKPHLQEASFYSAPSILGNFR